MSRVLIVQGHPDPQAGHFCHALADTYAAGAVDAEYEVRRIEVARLDFPLLRTKEDWKHGAPPTPIRASQDDIGWAEMLVIVYPRWLGSMPALLKAFLEQALRPDFAIGKGERGTMGMPALIYRWYFGAHSLKSLERNILKFCGIGPIRESLIGQVEAMTDARRQKCLSRMTAYG